MCCLGLPFYLLLVPLRLAAALIVAILRSRPALEAVAFTALMIGAALGSLSLALVLGGFFLGYRFRTRRPEDVGSLDGAPALFAVVLVCLALSFIASLNHTNGALLTNPVLLGFLFGWGLTPSLLSTIRAAWIESLPAELRQSKEGEKGNQNGDEREAKR